MDLMAFFHPDVFFKFLAALLALLNPLYGIPIFLSMTKGYSPAERNRTALIASIAVTATGLVATLIGEEVLGVFGIDIPSFRIAGGIIILGIALAMLKADEPSTGDAKAASEGHERKGNIAVVPLAIPLTIGPGAIATVIVFAHQLDDRSEIVTLVPVVLGVCFLVWLGLRFAAPIAALLGDTVISVITRIMAIILAAVAIEMVMTGVIDVVDQHYPNLRSERKESSFPPSDYAATKAAVITVTRVLAQEVRLDGATVNAPRHPDRDGQEQPR
jgi:multiple antibiotic resistance protein